MKNNKLARLSVGCAALLAAGCILEAVSVMPAYADQTVFNLPAALEAAETAAAEASVSETDSPEGPPAAAAAGISYEGLLLTVDGHTIDLASYQTLSDLIIDAFPVGDYVVAEGHVNPHISNYFLYNRNSGTVEEILPGANLTWIGDDLTTAVYSSFTEVYDFKGNPIGSTDAEVAAISLNADGTEATVTDFNEATYTFEVDQSDRAIYRYADYLKAPGAERWAALAETAPESALALVIINPPLDVAAFLPAVSVVDAGAFDALYIIPLKDGTTVRLDDAYYDPDTTEFTSTGTITEVKPAKGEPLGVQIVVPEGVPGRCVYVTADGASGMFPVATISGATGKCSTFITGTAAQAAETAAAETSAAGGQAASTDTSAAGGQAASGETGVESAFDAGDAYMDLLFKYKEAEAGAYSEQQLEEIKLRTELTQHGWPQAGSGTGVTYRFFDVNGDDINELIVSNYGSIVDIYAICGEGLSYAFGGLYRSESFLHEGGLLEELFAPSMDHASTTWYRFDATAGLYFPAFRM